MSPQLRKSPPKESKHRGKSIASFEDHVDYADPTIRPVLLELRAKIKSLDGGERKIKEKVTTHQRIAYSVAQIFAEVKVQKKRILIRFFGMNSSDPKNITTNIPVTHRWQHDKEIALDSFGLIDYAMPFIEASYRSNRSMLPAR
jgi:predicted transport protein